MLLSGRSRARAAHSRVLSLLPATAAAAVFFAIGSRLAGVGALEDHEAWHAETTICLLDPLAAPGREYYPSMPWMRDSYNGALKVYLLYPAFRVAGARLGTLRMTMVGVGTLAILLLVLIVQRLHGPWVAAAAGLFFATDPVAVLATWHDSGPQILMLLLKTAGMLCWCASLEHKRRGVLAFFAGLFWGLALWDKAHFAWFLAAFAATSWIFPGRFAWTTGDLARALAGLIAGAFPLLAYNVAHPLGTLLESGHLGNFRSHLSGLGSAVASRLEGAKIALTGRGSVLGWDGPAALNIDWTLKAAALCGLAGSAAWRRDLPALRRALFWLSLAAAILLAAAASPLPVKFHHLYLLYPFPHLAAIALLAPAVDARSWRARGALLLVVTLVAGANARLLLSKFPADLARTGGRDQAHETIVNAVGWMEEHHRRFPQDSFLVHSSLDRRIRFYTEGRIPRVVLPDVGEAGTLLVTSQLFGAAGQVAVMPVSADRSLPPYVRTSLQRLSMGALPIGRVDRKDGSPWIEFLRLGRPRLDPARHAPAWRHVESQLRWSSPAKADSLLAAMVLHRHDVSTWIKIAEAASTLGLKPQARQALEQAERGRPDKNQRRALAGLWLGLGRGERALSLLDRVEAEHGRDAAYWMEVVQAAQAAGLRPRVEQALERAERGNPDKDQRRALAGLWLGLGRGERALSLLDRVEAEHGRDAAYWMEVVQAARAAGLRPRVEQALERAERGHPDKDQRRTLAALWRELGRHERSLTLLEDLAHTHPGETADWIEVAQAALAAGLRPRAEQALERAERGRPDAGRRRQLAELWGSLGKAQRSLALLESVGPSQAGEAAYWIEVAQAALAAGLRPRAEQALERAERGRPDAGRRRQLAELWGSLGKAQRSLALLESVGPSQAGEAAYWIEVARSALSAGLRPRAEETLERAERLGLDHTLSHAAALIRQELGQCQAAVDILTRLIDRNPHDASIYADRGLCQQILGRGESAIRDLRRALELDPACLAAALTLGSILSSAGRLEEARRVYVEAEEASAGSSHPLRRELIRSRAALR